MSVATPPADGGMGGMGGGLTPTAAPPPVDEACPLCGAPLESEQEWCLRCGAAARTRLAASPAWKTPVIVLAVVVALSLGVLAAALVKLAGDGSGHTAKAPTTITVTTPATTPTATVPSATVPTTTTPATTAPATPGTSTPSTGLSTTTASPGSKSSTNASGLSTPTTATTAPGHTLPTTGTTPKTTTTTPARTKSSEAPPSSNPLVAPESPKK